MEILNTWYEETGQTEGKKNVDLCLYPFRGIRPSRKFLHFHCIPSVSNYQG